MTTALFEPPHTKIVFTVPAVPVAQPRQRTRAFVTKTGRLASQNFTPANHPVQDYKASVRAAAKEAYQGSPLEGPIGIRILYVMPRRKGLMLKKRPMVRIWHTTVPDADNLAKASFDALKKLVWNDDAQLCSVYVAKVIAAGNEQPHVRIEITTIGEYPG